MRDSLDLEALAKQGDEYKQYLRRLARRGWITFGVIFVITLLISAPVSPPGQLYVLDDIEHGQWREVPLKGVATDLQVADNGDLWVSTEVKDGLFRYDGESWTFYNRDDFGLDDSEVIQFALKQNELWGTVDNSVIHFDGESWTAYPNVLSACCGAGIAVGDFGVLVVDYDGSIARLKYGRWFTEKVRDVLPGYVGGESDFWPSLVQSPDGDVWLAYYGFWRFDGQKWEKIGDIDSRYPEYYWFLGASDTQIWSAGPYGVSVYDRLSEKWHDYDFEDIGLEWVKLRDVQFINQTAWLATRDGIYVHEADAWTPLPLSAHDVDYSIHDLAYDRRGALWMTIYDYDRLRDASVRDALAYLFGVSGATILIIVFLFVWLLPRSTLMRRRSAMAHERFLVLFPDSPVYTSLEPDPEKVKNRWLYFALPLGTAIVLSLMNVSIVIVIGLIILSVFLPIFLRAYRFNTASRKYYFRNFGLALICMLPLMGLMVGAFDIMMPIVEKIVVHYGLALEITLVMGALSAIIVWNGLAGLPGRWFIRALKKADYPVALTRIRKIQHLYPQNAGHLQQEIFTLMLMGDFERAESLSHEMLTEAQHSSVLYMSIGLSNLGSALMASQRYDEALPYVEEAAKILPENDIAYVGLSMFYLDQNSDIDRAKLITDTMMHFSRKPRFNISPFGLYNWGIVLGTRALVLALSGDFEGADMLITRALRETARSFRPGMAVLHVMAGKIKLLKNEVVNAREHFRHALELDPNGAAGKEAHEALDGLDGKSAQERDGDNGV